MSASTLLHSLFQYKVWADQTLLAELAKLDPVAHQAERHAAIRILNHAHVVDRIFAAHLLATVHGYTATNTVETPTLAELTSAVAACDQWYIEYVAALAPEALSERIAFTFTDGAGGQMSREEMLAHVITHGGYHRGAVGRIMSQLSVDPPRDIYTAYLHAAEPPRRSQR
ncbi:MAG TPA: DinB family protein [Burkholderiaceae bacterium]|nr:DinB family protein [Burkholderiaceae bacterium]